MRSLAGTLTLLRLAVRVDRVKLPAWIAAIIGLLAVGTPAIRDLYQTTESQLQYAATTAPSVIARLFGGPVDGPNIGSILMIEYFLFLAVLVAFMNTLLVVRHTRQNEETGRAELLASLEVGRHAALAAALMLASLANILVSTLLFLILHINDMPNTGAVLMAAGIGAIGVVFAIIAAVVSQFYESSRAANSICAAIIGGAFLVRGVGDTLGSVYADGLSSTSAWITWLSPFGWAQQMHPFTSARAWPLLVYATVSFVLCVGAFYLLQRRDIGSGLLAMRPGPAHAPQLTSSFALASRLQKNTLLGWTIGISILGVVAGVTAIEFQSFLTENSNYTEILQHLGGVSNLTDTYFAAMYSVMGLTICGYALQALLRLRSEESAGHLELTLAAPTSRLHWLGGHIGYVLLGLICLFLTAGLSTAISYMLTAGLSIQATAYLIPAIFTQLPAVLVIASVALCAFSFAPRFTSAIAWGAFAICIAISQLGAILRLPQWIVNLSPFTHSSTAPAENVDVVAVVWLMLVSAALVASTAVYFKRRDINP